LRSTHPSIRAIGLSRNGRFLREQNESERQHPKVPAPAKAENAAEDQQNRERNPASNQSRGQFAPAFADFFGLRGLALTDFREDAGLMLRGLPEATGVTTGAASGSLKYTRQPGVS
jgi:hypothetical protein